MIRIAFLSTGDELLDGTAVDTNLAHFAGHVHERGASMTAHRTVHDDLDALRQAFVELASSADLVVSSGGMGPTQDDLTVEAAALAAGAALVTDPSVLEQLKARFAERGYVFTPNNARQARIPVGAIAHPNPFGTAPVVQLAIANAEVWLLPGVPREFVRLVDSLVLPRLDAQLESMGTERTACRTLKVMGLGESLLETLVADLPARHPAVRFGYRTHLPENHLKLRAFGATQAEADARLACVEAEARERLGQHLFGADHDELAEIVLRRLLDHGATVALAESCTGGLCASLLTEIPRASEALVFSAVVYADRAKSILLDLPPSFVAAEGAVSEPVTRALAEAARHRAGADYGLAITGYAGPAGGTNEAPVGTVYVALADAAGIVAESRRFFGERNQVRRHAAFLALDLLRRRLGPTSEGSRA